MIFMYVNITGSKNNKDVYIYQSYRKANGNLFPAFTENWANTMIYLSSFPVILTN